VSAKSEANKQPHIVLVVAAADNDVIGRDGKLPWHLRSDLQHFRALTMGTPVVMGRKTYLSIGRPLPGRTNIVVSRDPGFATPGLVIAPTLRAALTAARGDALRRGSEIMMIGGAEIFAQLLPAAARLELTRVHLRPEGDVLLPPIEWGEWEESARCDFPQGPHDDASFTVTSYRRIAQQ
jgi:dihydrofolate reductase